MAGDSTRTEAVPRALIGCTTERRQQQEGQIHPGRHDDKQVEPTPPVAKIGLLVPPEAQATHLQDHLKCVQYRAEHD